MGEEIWMILELFRSGPSKQVHRRLALTAEEIRHANQGPRHLRVFRMAGFPTICFISGLDFVLAASRPTS